MQPRDLLPTVAEISPEMMRNESTGRAEEEDQRRLDIRRGLD